MSTDHAETAARLGVDQPWRKDAACAGRSDVMDPGADQIAAAKQLGAEGHLWSAAKQVCAGCPVYWRCRQWALSLPAGGDVSGVCGGLTEAERTRLRRRTGQAETSKAAARGNWDSARAARSAETTARYERYLELREAGRSDQQIAEVLGVSPTSVRRYEQRRRKEGRT